jgi:hypothetical protein
MDAMDEMDAIDAMNAMDEMDWVYLPRPSPYRPCSP